MEISKGVTVDYKEGKVVIEIGVAEMAVPQLESFKAKIASGEVDLIKNTDIDKTVLLPVLDLAIAALKK